MTKASPFPTAVKKQTLAEQVADSIREAVLAGQWRPGEALPTEPELAEAFGVSRAVVRDATRMLAAQGLVEAQHGRGVFVTESQVEAFGDALLLALRREDATVWDVEQFEQMVFPEVCALAADEASEEEIAKLRSLGENYIDVFTSMSTAEWEDGDPASKAARDTTSEAFAALISAVFDATHNAMWQLLARPILRLRSIRSWDVADVDPSPELFIEMEKRFVTTLVGAVASGNSQTARDTVSRLMRLPTEAETAMRSTPVGEVPQIQVAYRPSIDD